MEAINKSTEPITAAALLQKPEDGYRYELVQGELVRMSPTGGRHGIIAMRLGRLLGNWADEYQIGVVCAAETGFKLKSDPDTVRAADVSLVRQSRIPAQGAPETFWEGHISSKQRVKARCNNKITPSLIYLKKGLLIFSN
jgi:Uma2 family endonuclease